MSTKTEVAEKLNHFLADSALYYQKLRNYHWNVRGKKFFQLHEEFEELYNQQSTFVDDIAERVSRLGTQPLSTLASFVENGRIEETGGNLSADEMVRNLIGDIETLEGFALEVIETAEEANDVATCNMLEDMVEAQESNAWMLSCWLNE
jgi:starvation-inducible DNA-binding protein